MSEEPRRDLGLGIGDSHSSPQSAAPDPQRTDSEFPASHRGSQGIGRDGWWRTLEEQAGDPAFQERLYNEFPSQIEAITDPVARRTFLKLMGASLALAGVGPGTKHPAGDKIAEGRAPRGQIPRHPPK
jgi:MoCo/4Fe-4S cofactor protein with predicted Tat translocation signal